MRIKIIKLRSIKYLSCIMMGICLGGCGNQQFQVDDFVSNQVAASEVNASTKENNIEEEAQKDINGIAKEDIKVGVLHISDPDEGAGYSYTHDLGIQGMQANLGLTDEQVMRVIAADGDDQSVEAGLEQCVDEGCNVIFATSWGYMEKTAEFAERYPEIYFSHGTGYMSNGKNFNNYFGRIYQARYLSGIAAGLKTQSNKIGYVAAQDSSSAEVTGGIDAFAIGVASVNSKAEIEVIVTHSWYDPEAEKKAAADLLARGCDVLAQHCDTSYPQILAEEAGVWGIGYNSDMGKEAPHATLCSVMWNWSAYYTAAVQSLIDGSWDGSNYYGGMQDGLVSISNLANFNDEAAKEKINEATEKILSGELNVFDDVIETNTGETVGKEGTTLSDDVIKGEINWYYKNVVIVES